MKPIKVLSLFDGISCGLVALDRAGIEVAEYHTSEVDKNAILISDKNHGNRITKRGDVTNLSISEHFDLMIGGSPCQGFSTAGYGKGFDDPRSKLFWEYVRILEECKAINPKIKFLLENVRMKKEWLDIISNTLGCEPVFINSSEVSAQSRPRFYWANWNISPPTTKNIQLKDILIDTGDKPHVDREKSLCLTAHYHARTLMYERYINKIRPDQIVFTANSCRCLLPVECERLQTLPDNYTEGVAKSRRYILLGNSWTVDVIAHIFKELRW